MEVPTELTVVLEVLDVQGLSGLWEAAGLGLIASGATGFRSAVTVCGQVVYAAPALQTQNPVRLGGLPCGTNLALGILPPASADTSETGAAELLLTTAPLALRSMIAHAQPAPGSSGALAGELLWEGWLPLQLNGAWRGLDETLFSDARMQVSVLLEEPAGLKAPLAAEVSPMEPSKEPSMQREGSNVALHSASAQRANLSPTSIHSEGCEDQQLEKAQSFKLELCSARDADELACANEAAIRVHPSLLGGFTSEPGSSSGWTTPPVPPESFPATDSTTTTACLLSPADAPAVTNPRSPKSPPTSGRLCEESPSRPSSNEVALEIENKRLRAGLERSKKEVDHLRMRSDEDRLRVQEKLLELEAEVRGRWQERVTDLEREVAILHASLSSTTASSPGMASAVDTASTPAQTRRRHSVPEYGTPLLQPPISSPSGMLDSMAPGPIASIDAVAACIPESSRLPGAFPPAGTSSSSSSVPTRQQEPMWSLSVPVTPTAQFAAMTPERSPGLAAGQLLNDGRQHGPSSYRHAGPMQQVPGHGSPASGGLKPPPGLRVAGLGPMGLSLPQEFAKAPWTPEAMAPTMGAGSSTAELAPDGPPSTRIPPHVGMMTPLRSYWSSPYDPDGDGPRGCQADSRPPSPPRPSLPHSPQSRQPRLAETRWTSRASNTVHPASGSHSSDGRSAVQAQPASGSHPSVRIVPAPFGEEARCTVAASMIGAVPGARSAFQGRSQSVPILARPPGVPEQGLFGFFEAFGGFFSSQLEGTKCTGPDALAINERLVEIDLSGEFPPERRAAQVDLAPLMTQSHRIRMARI